MDDRCAPLAERLKETVFTTPGDLDPAVRRAVAEGGAGVPDEMRPYADKVTLHAYKVTDADVAALKDAGYSEDAIFEATLAAALGAGLVRLERGLEALGR